MFLINIGVVVGPGRDPETRKYIAIEDRMTLDWRPLPQHQEDDEDEEALAAA